MCHVIKQAVDLAEQQRLTRRGLLKTSAAATGAGLAGAALPMAARAERKSRMRHVHEHQRSAARHRTRMVLLGTSGGPLWWPGTDRTGVASAAVVGDSVYLVDLGEGVFSQYRRAGLAPIL